MRPPCEEIFKDILPTIRAVLVKDLVERHDLNQVEVAKRLGITQPAISQYLRSLRGKGQMEALLKRNDFMKSLRDLSDVIAREGVRGIRMAEMYCNLCSMLRKEKIKC